MIDTFITDFKTTVHELLLFLKHPVDKPNKKLTNREIFKQIIMLFVTGLIVIIFSEALTSSLTAKLDLGKHALGTELTDHPFYTFVVGATLYPILEELIFRYCITFRRAFYFIWFLKPLQIITGESRFHMLKAFKKNWNIIFPTVFYLSAIIFAFVHATNFEFYKHYLWAIPIITLPQFILGITLGYARVRFGIQWSVILHIIHNSILLILVLLFS